jgi:hypothetical protein
MTRTTRTDDGVAQSPKRPTAELDYITGLKPGILGGVSE